MGGKKGRGNGEGEANLPNCCLLILLIWIPTLGELFYSRSRRVFGQGWA